METNKEKETTIEIPRIDFVDKEIDLHIAEYDVLINRATYFINIQFVLLTALIAWVVVLGQIWNPQLGYIFNWALIIGAQVLGIINANMLWENYCIISYIETDLKPKIIKLTNKDGFWGYEPFLSKLRETKKTKNSMTLMDFIGTLMAFIIIIATTIYRFNNWIILDWLGLILNILLFVVLFMKTYQTVKLRLNSWK